MFVFRKPNESYSVIWTLQFSTKFFSLQNFLWFKIFIFAFFFSTAVHPPTHALPLRQFSKHHFSFALHTHYHPHTLTHAQVTPTKWGSEWLIRQRWGYKTSKRNGRSETLERRSGLFLASTICLSALLSLLGWFVGELYPSRFVCCRSTRLWLLVGASLYNRLSSNYTLCPRWI